MKTPHIGIINRFYPPHQSATGYYGNLLARHLEEDLEAEVFVFSQKGNYHNIKSGGYKVHGILNHTHSLYKGRKKWLRFLSSFIASFILILKARWAALDFYIVMTDPPFNNFWAALLLKTDSYALWTMDLYPDAFVANRLVKEQNVFYKAYQKTLQGRPPSFLICLGSAQVSHIRKTYPNTDIIIIPIGLKKLDTQRNVQVLQNGSQITLAYVGNLGEAHESKVLVEIADALMPNHRLVLSIYGSQAEDIQKELGLHPQVKIADRLSESEMHDIDIQIVSLKEVWTHICVPSKALSALQYGSAILFFGSPRSDTWQFVRDAGWQIDVDRMYTKKIKTLIEGLTNEGVFNKRQSTPEIVLRLQDDFDQGMQALINNIRIKLKR